jgi:hypothetical protein
MVFTVKQRPFRAVKRMRLEKRIRDKARAPGIIISSLNPTTIHEESSANEIKEEVADCQDKGPITGRLSSSGAPTG